MEPILQNPSSRYRILVVEDDKGVARTVRSGLEAHGYEVREAETGEEGMLMVADYKPHLLILDLNLPGRGGLEILQQLREEGDDTRVLVLTSHNEVEDRILGLRKGADDYLGKPFSIGELEARVEVLLRRGVSQENTTTLRLADLVLDKNAHSVWRSGQKLPLTQREFELLQYLLEHKGRAVSREMLARDIWRETSRFTPIDGVIDVQMTRLRQKIDDPFPTRLLQTIRGVGYSLREPEV
jgi:DNA-binding response OmpR family regulator